MKKLWYNLSSGWHTIKHTYKDKEVLVKVIHWGHNHRTVFVLAVDINTHEELGNLTVLASNINPESLILGENPENSNNLK